MCRHLGEVVICTELNWKFFIKSYRSGLPEGTLRFRPAGGDTMAQTRTALPRGAYNWGLRPPFSRRSGRDYRGFACLSMVIRILLASLS